MNLLHIQFCDALRFTSGTDVLFQSGILLRTQRKSTSVPLVKRSASQN